MAHSYGVIRQGRSAWEREKMLLDQINNKTNISVREGVFK
jgi:hypothetical protein